MALGVLILSLVPLPHSHPHVSPGYWAAVWTPSQWQTFSESGFWLGITFIPSLTDPRKQPEGRGIQDLELIGALCPGFGLPLLARPAGLLFAGLLWVTWESLVPRGDRDQVLTLLHSCCLCCPSCLLLHEYSLSTLARTHTHTHTHRFVDALGPGPGTYNK